MRPYDTPEYRRNRAAIVAEVRRRQQAGIIVRCVICEEPITLGQTVTIEHLVKVQDGGSNALSNLAPAHSICNSSKGAAKQSDYDGPVYIPKYARRRDGQPRKVYQRPPARPPLYQQPNG